MATHSKICMRINGLTIESVLASCFIIYIYIHLLRLHCKHSILCVHKPTTNVIHNCCSRPVETLFIYRNVGSSNVHETKISHVLYSMIRNSESHNVFRCASRVNTQKFIKILFETLSRKLNCLHF